MPLTRKPRSIARAPPRRLPWHASCSSARLPEDQPAGDETGDDLPGELDIADLRRDVVELRHESRQEEVATDDDENGKDETLHDLFSAFCFAVRTTKMLVVIRWVTTTSNDHANAANQTNKSNKRDKIFPLDVFRNHRQRYKKRCGKDESS